MPQTGERTAMRHTALVTSFLILSSLPAAAMADICAPENGKFSRECVLAHYDTGVERTCTNLSGVLGRDANGRRTCARADGTGPQRDRGGGVGATAGLSGATGSIRFDGLGIISTQGMQTPDLFLSLSTGDTGLGLDGSTTGRINLFWPDTGVALLGLGGEALDAGMGLSPMLRVEGLILAPLESSADNNTSVEALERLLGETGASQRSFTVAPEFNAARLPTVGVPQRELGILPGSGSVPRLSP